MRLWHEKLINLLPREQLLGQHRECCALRGAGWGRPHATVNYVFDHPKEWLYCYHIKVMSEMLKRGYRVDPLWLDISYQGRNLPRKVYTAENLPNTPELNEKLLGIVYPEHNDDYLAECINNLAAKGIFIHYVDNNIPLEDFYDE